MRPLQLIENCRKREPRPSRSEKVIERARRVAIHVDSTQLLAVAGTMGAAGLSQLSSDEGHIDLKENLVQSFHGLRVLQDYPVFSGVGFRRLANDPVHLCLFRDAPLIFRRRLLARFFRSRRASPGETPVASKPSLRLAAL